MGINYSDADFCLKKELWHILDKHSSAIRDSAFVNPSDPKWLNLYNSYSEQKSDTLTVLTCLEKLAMKHDDFDNAVKWSILATLYSESHKDFPVQETSELFFKKFKNEPDSLVLDAYLYGINEDSLYASISRLKSYNSYIEDLAKALLDLISVERDDSLATVLIDKFNQTFPYSKWVQAVYYFELSQTVRKKDYGKLRRLMDNNANMSMHHGYKNPQYLPARRYLTTLFLTSPTLRRETWDKHILADYLGEALGQLDYIRTHFDTVLVLYDNYSPSHWQAKLQLLRAKVMYYRALEGLRYYGDEDSLVAIIHNPEKMLKGLTRILTEIQSQLDEIKFENNNGGEFAELSYWKGKYYALFADKKSLKTAAIHFTECLVHGAPRKKYDLEAIRYLERIHQKLKIKTDLLTWHRKLLNYKGITFDDVTISAGLGNLRETRIALGDYNNDSFCDILLNGRRLYKNNGDLTFSEMTDSLGLEYLNSSGGLFADFNLDGRLDFMTISHGDEGNGERLMKNMGNSFAPVNDRAGEIDDKFPTEGAAWIDCFGDGYPELYCANYEKWQVQSGFEDRFWNNEKGYFSDKSEQWGFLKPDYTKNPGQAGRGVAPADFDNDGEQEILVTNYRLCRNFLWDKQDTLFIDVAALNGIQGILKQGYYGHSIGADWGDFDNDGDLDLFIANLAHPRYIDISDISQLLRNDGLKHRVIEGDTISYWQFTNVTKQAGITFDELHSDPLWFDADNDGWLDLFITSVYENDRSYLYHNNGDGTFTDITWLAGVRVYNGWGNACADINHDGKLDLVVGSGNGTKIFLNETLNKNKSMTLKPVWNNGQISLGSSYPEMINLPNSPAYGTRVILNLKNPKGKQFKLFRELSSAKGTTSQNDQILHFGLGRNKVISYEIFQPQLIKR